MFIYLLSILYLFINHYYVYFYYLLLLSSSLYNDNNNNKLLFLDFAKTIEEYYHCLWGCRGFVLSFLIILIQQLHRQL